MGYNDNNGCATVIAVLVVVALVIFLGPWVVQMGYNAVKLDFNLPDLNYWQFFWATNALQVIFKTSSSVTTKK
jgi:H+/Cl- antiporter ClcA